MNNDSKIYATLTVNPDEFSLVKLFDKISIIEDKYLFADFNKQRSKVTFIIENPQILQYVEDLLQQVFKNKYTAIFEVSADIEDTQDTKFNYRLYYGPGLKETPKQFMLKLFPAKTLIS